MLYINLKNGRVYKYLNLALNATNNSSGEMMVCYKDFETETIYVREEKEFFNKFEPVEVYCGAVDHYIQGVS